MGTYKERVEALRRVMKEKGFDATIIPSADPHLGEYVPDHWKIINWLTGFTGSAATVVVTRDKADLFTDSRYYLQAAAELEGSGVGFRRPVVPKDNDYLFILASACGKKSKVALDGRLFSVTRIRKIEEELGRAGIAINTDCDLFEDIWDDRPSMPGSPAFDHPVRYSGKERAVKISEVRETMKEAGVTHHLLSSPDDIMWLLNIRGRDLEYTPVIFCFALITELQILLFVDERKIGPRLAMAFDSEDIVILPYEEAASMTEFIPDGSVVLLNPDTTSLALYKSVPGGAEIKEETSIPARMKAVKNRVETENMERAMVKDGIALTRFFYWLEQASTDGELNEYNVAEKLHGFRSEQPEFICPSFKAIVAFNENGAMPHYTASSSSAREISGSGILLIDSGAQYHDGTTDITRTVALGMPDEKQKKDFTLVLKGMISLARARFPFGTRGYQLDILARRYLWEQGLNYGHGTGHGVGFCLSVHEGPQSITPAENRTVIVPGMLMSDEPAIYREGEYGIRTENLILCYEDEETEFGRFLRFDTMSLCYIDMALVDRTMLDRSELAWLKNYHREVNERLSPGLPPEEAEWLKTKTIIAEG